MPSRKGFALKTVQWFLRGIQFCSVGLVLAIYSWFLATLHNHDLPIATWIRAVEGISGAAALYTACGLALLCCVAGHPLTSFLAIVLDAAFAAAFVYVAYANRGGAGDCKGQVDTPFGSGDADQTVVDNGHGGFTSLPKLGQACQFLTACFSVSLVAIFFFVFSILVEIQLARHRSREKRFGPSPANNYTSGSGKTGGGLFGWFRRRTMRRRQTDNMLPEHTHPDQLEDTRPSYATETTAVNNDHPPHSPTYNKYGESGYGYGGQSATYDRYGNGSQQVGTTPATHPAGYRYEDGVFDRR